MPFSLILEFSLSVVFSPHLSIPVLPGASIFVTVGKHCLLDLEYSSSSLVSAGSCHVSKAALMCEIVSLSYSATIYLLVHGFYLMIKVWNCLWSIPPHWIL